MSSELANCCFIEITANELNYANQAKKVIVSK